MKSVSIHYGKEIITLKIKENSLRHELKPADIMPVENVQDELLRALRDPVNSDDLSRIVSRGNKVVILADDITRLTPVRDILPHVLIVLNKAGVPDKDITLVIALGTHRSMSDAEIKEKYGEEVVRRIKIINHDCLNKDMLVHYGTTRRGTDIWVNRTVVEADVRIAVGNIVPHHPTGWSGGAKILLPGVAGQLTTGQFHLLGATKQLLGEIETPCREEMEDFASNTNLEFIINTVLDRNGRIVRIVAGHMIDAHREGVKWGRRVFGAPFSEKTDITISSTFPVDFDLFQADKGLFSAAISTKKGGEIILLSPCYEGVSPTHPEAVDLAGLTSAELMELANNPHSGHDPLSIAEVLYFNTAKKGFKVTLVSDGIPDNIAEKLNFNPVKVRDLQGYLDRKLREDMTVGVIHNSAETLPVESSGK